MKPATFDIEATDWANPIAVGFFDGVEYHEFIKNNFKEDVIWEFLQFLAENYQGSRIYAHFASRYDNKFILASLIKHDEKVELLAGLARLKWNRVNISFEDSYLIAPMSLEKLSLAFEVGEKGKWDHTKNLRPWEMGSKLTTFKEYLKNDCITLSDSLYKLCEVIGLNFGVMPSISLSTTSAKAFNKYFYKLDLVESNEKFETYIRQATYGGRNEVYKRYGENINQYDVKSMYVACYDSPMPIGTMQWTKGSLDRGTLAEAKVKVPVTMNIGPLPLRVKDRLIFPVGEFKGWWDMRELREAANMGVDITILRQLDCIEEPILEGFKEKLEPLRSGGPLDHFWKMFGLSLSGKFGQSRWRDTIRHFTFIEDYTGYYPLDKDEEYFTIKEYTKRLPYIKPALAMRVRAESRIRHLRIIRNAASQGEVFYGDTDSIHTTSVLPIGNKIGDLTHIGKSERGYYIKQKFYALVEKGKFNQKSAGHSDLKLTETDFKELLQGKEIMTVSNSISNIKSILTSSEVKVVSNWRQIKGKSPDSRISEGLSTRPIILPEELHLVGS